MLPTGPANGFGKQQLQFSRNRAVIHQQEQRESVLPWLSAPVARQAEGEAADPNGF